MRCCSHGGITEAQGKLSFGRPIPPFDTPPEDKRFLQLRDGTWVGEVGGDRVECERVKSTSVKIVPVAEMTILKEDFASLADIL